MTPRRPDELAAWVAASRAAQGLPEHVEDERTLTLVAFELVEGRCDAPAA
jgi:hypothetical protein